MSQSDITLPRLSLIAQALLIICASGSSTAALAQQSSKDEEQVIVTGTRSLKRSLSDSEVPVDVINQRDLQNAGGTELASVLSRLLPALNFPRPAVADGTSASRPAQLRGLSPDQTLVLVDGKRWHSGAVVNVNGTAGRGSAPVDLNSIAISSIERIEVLRDGAAAQYGSDAIAGVINIILKKGPGKNETSLSTGKYSAGDGQSYQFSTNLGWSLSERGWLRLGLDHKKQDETNRAGADFRNPLEPLYGKVTQKQGDPDLRQTNLTVNGNYQLTQDLELYGISQYSRRETDAAASWRTAYSSGTTLRSPLYPQGFLPNQHAENTDQALIVGIKGDTGNWRWDSSINYGQNNFQLDLNNTVNLSLGANSPRQFYIGQLRNRQTAWNFDANTDINLAGLNKPANFAWGLEYRQERYQIEAGEPNSYTGSGAQGFSGFQPANAGSRQRHSSAAYANLEWQWTPKFSQTVALRYENFSDFGSVVAGKVSARYEISPQLSLRSAYSTGFRAPSLAQQAYTISTSNLVTVNGTQQLVETGTFAVASAAAKALGAQDLQAEKSRNLSLGLNFQPSKSTSLSLDWYQIAIDKRILYSGNLVLPANLQSVLAQQGILVGAARYFANALDTQTRGVDLVASQQFDLASAGKLGFTLSYNYNKTEVSNIAANPAILTQNKLTLVDKQTIERATLASPKNKLVLSADYDWQNWLAHAQLTRYGSFVVPQNLASLDQRFSANQLLDLALSYRHANWTFSAAIDNVTDKYPDQVTANGNLNTGGTLPYSAFSPYGFNGRGYSLKASYRW